MRRYLLPVIACLIIIFIPKNIYANDNILSDEIAPRTGYIYTGDSRIRRLNLTIRMDELKDTWVVCKSGMGYSWFVNVGLSQINDIIESKEYIDNWVIVSGWGVNDLWNLQTYIREYKRLLKNEWKDCRLYLMSVNPVNGRAVSKYGGISYFNSRIKEYADKKKKVEYIDTYSVMMKKGFGTIDGLHYTESTNRLIYSTIRDSLCRDNAGISYKRVVMHIGSQKALEVVDCEGECIWDADNTSTAIVNRISKKGKKAIIKALTPGRCMVTVRCGDTYMNCEIIVLSATQSARKIINKGA